jgi:hypothetical protein
LVADRVGSPAKRACFEPRTTLLCCEPGTGLLASSQFGKPSVLGLLSRPQPVAASSRAQVCGALALMGRAAPFGADGGPPFVHGPLPGWAPALLRVGNPRSAVGHGGGPGW